VSQPVSNYLFTEKFG